MRLYSNPKHSDEYLKEIELQKYRERLKKESIEIGKFLLRDAALFAAFCLIALSWSVLGN